MAAQAGVVEPEEPPLVLQSKDVEPTGTVIWMHGLGDTPMGWAQTCAQLHKASGGRWKFILPHAFVQPVTCNGGMSMTSWMDLAEIPIHIKSPDSGAQQQQSIEYVLSLAAKEAAAGIPANRIVFGGFSQGGAMSLAATVSSGAKLAGCVCMSGWALPHQNLGSKIRSCANKDTPFLVAHGEADQVVLAENGPHVAKLLVDGGAGDCTLKTYPGMAHSSRPQEEKDVFEFLKRVLP